jgi:molecular chaperone DnaJ
MTEDFYEILGVSRDASEEEIKEAYRKKAREYHPDVSEEADAEEKFKKVKKAKEVLTDEEKRQVYDQVGHERFEQAEKHGGVGGNGSSARGGDPFGGAGGGFSGMQDIFDQFFGGGGGRGRSGPQQGSNLRTSLTIDLEDAYEGIETELSVRRPEQCGECGGRGHPSDSDSRTCPQCNGQGQQTQVQQTPMGRVQQTQTCQRCEGDGTLYEQTCSTCRGEGTVRNAATLTVEIPAGISSGQTLRMDGEGAQGDRGARAGDLLIEVTVRDNPEFERDGDDLKHNLAVSFPQAVFGDTVEVPTLDGNAEFEIPAGTQSGEVFRLRGKGMPRLRRRGSGDLFVQVQIVTPESLNADQREALESFAEAGGEEVDVEEGFFEKIKNSL